MDTTPRTLRNEALQVARAIGHTRAQTFERASDLHLYGSTARRLDARDLVPLLGSRQRAALLRAADGSWVSARMFNRLWIRLDLLSYALGGRASGRGTRWAPPLTDYGAAVVRWLGGCPHPSDSVRGLPGIVWETAISGRVTYAVEECSECGKRRRIREDRRDREGWESPERWAVFLALPGVRAA